LNRGEFISSEFKRVGKGGKQVSIQASHNPKLDMSGKVFKIVKFATDTPVWPHRNTRRARSPTACPETVGKSAGGAAHAREIVTVADRDAKQSSIIVRQAVLAMDGISELARKSISKILRG
jgi:hypothetical protein